MITFEALVFVLLCAAGWATLDLLRKLMAEHAAPVPSSLLLVVGQIPLFVLWVYLDDRLHIAAAYWRTGILVIVLNLLANLAFMESVRHSAMSRTVPLLSLTPVFATLVAIPTLGEHPTPIEALGIALVVTMAVVIARRSAADRGAPSTVPSTVPSTAAEPDASGSASRGEGRGRSRGRGSGFDRGGWLMAFVALCWSITPTLDKLSMAHASPAVHALVVVTGISLGLAAVAHIQGRMAEVRAVFGHRRALVLAIASTVVAAFASGVQLLAYERASVGLVETVKRGLGATLALAFGYLVFAETIGWRRALAVGLMVGGVAMVLLAG